MNGDHYTVMAYRRSCNLGDAIQTYALCRLLGGQCSAIYRDQVGFKEPLGTMLVNGWLGDNGGRKTVPAFFAGVFIGGNHLDNLEWLARHSAGAFVGARDPFTRRRLQTEGVPARMLGCATLTLPRYNGPRSGVLHIDDGTTGCLHQAIARDMPWKTQWELAGSRIKELAQASAVYTSRLHVALPCLALGTPVCCIPGGDQFTERFSLLDALGVQTGRIVVSDVTNAAETFREALKELVGRELPSQVEPEMPGLLHDTLATDAHPIVFRAFEARHTHWKGKLFLYQNGWFRGGAASPDGLWEFEDDEATLVLRWYHWPEDRLNKTDTGYRNGSLVLRCASVQSGQA